MPGQYLDPKGNTTTYLDDNGNELADINAIVGPEQNIPDEGPEQPTWSEEFAHNHPTLANVWNKINTSLTPITPEMRQHMGEFTQEHPIVGRLGEMGAGAMEGGTSPLGIGLMGAAEARPLLELAGMTKAAKAASGVSRVAGAGFAGHGVSNIYSAITDPNATGAEKTGKVLEGSIEALMGGLAARGHVAGKAEIADKAALGKRLEAIAAEDSPKKFYKPVKGLLPARSQVTDFIADDAGNVLPNKSVVGPLGEKIDPAVAIQSANVNPVEAPARSLDPAAYAEGSQRQAQLAGMNTDDWIRASQGLPPYPRETVNPATMSNPPVSGDTGLGFSPQSAGPLPYPLNIVPNRFRPRAEQAGVLNRLPEAMQPRLNPIESGARTVTLSDEGIRARTAEPYQAPELPSATRIGTNSRTTNITGT